MTTRPLRALGIATAAVLVLASGSWAAALPSDTPSGSSNGGARGGSSNGGAPGGSSTGGPSGGSSTGSPFGGEPVVIGEEVLTTEGVAVTTYGVVTFRGYQDQDQAVQTMAVHGVQRVERGTVVYVSLGYDGAEQPDSGAWSELVSTQTGARYGGGGGLTGLRVVDRSTDEALSVLREPDIGVLTGALSTSNSGFPDEAGVMVAAYAVLPELAAGTDTVDVQLAFGLTVADVPVADGVLEPVVTDDGPVPLGTGWPQVDLTAVAAAPEPDLSRHPLTRVQQSLGGETTTTEEAETVTVDVAADVLFAFDSADLTPEARATLQAIGEDVAARASGTTLQVVGHTDSEGSNAYNDDLSLRRAQAAAAVLGRYAEQAGLQLQVEGRGEREPVADNGSDDGRQANRRVSVTFDVGGQGR